jgi:hypothetical protein
MTPAQQASVHQAESWLARPSDLLTAETADLAKIRDGIRTAWSGAKAPRVVRQFLDRVLQQLSRIRRGVRRDDPPVARLARKAVSLPQRPQQPLTTSSPYLPNSIEGDWRDWD